VTEESAVRINSAKNFNNEISFKRKYRFFAPWAQNDKNAWLGFKAKIFLVWLSSFRSFARILFLPLFQELFLAFFMSRVWNAAVYRTNLSAFGGRKPANAFSAFSGVDVVYRFPFFDGLVFTFWLAGTAANAFVSDFVRHFLNLTSLDFIKATVFLLGFLSLG
jgi:hypothetical protein